MQLTEKELKEQE
jgi:hypothetical protein